MSGIQLLEVHQMSLPITSYLSNGGEPLPDGAAFTRMQYYDTTGSIL